VSGPRIQALLPSNSVSGLVSAVTPVRLDLWFVPSTVAASLARRERWSAARRAALRLASPRAARWGAQWERERLPIDAREAARSAASAAWSWPGWARAADARRRAVRASMVGGRETRPGAGYL
jgi:uncharacterized protein with von Willebrand factor type A (vWA) domain